MDENSGGDITPQDTPKNNNFGGWDLTDDEAIKNMQGAKNMQIVTRIISIIGLIASTVGLLYTVLTTILHSQDAGMGSGFFAAVFLYIYGSFWLFCLVASIKGIKKTLNIKRNSNPPENAQDHDFNNRESNNVGSNNANSEAEKTRSLQRKLAFFTLALSICGLLFVRFYEFDWISESLVALPVGGLSMAFFLASLLELSRTSKNRRNPEKPTVSSKILQIIAFSISFFILTIISSILAESLATTSSQTATIVTLTAALSVGGILGLIGGIGAMSKGLGTRYKQYIAYSLAIFIIIAISSYTYFSNLPAKTVTKTLPSKIATITGNYKWQIKYDNKDMLKQLFFSFNVNTVESGDIMAEVYLYNGEQLILKQEQMVSLVRGDNKPVNLTINLKDLVYAKNIDGFFKNGKISAKKIILRNMGNYKNPISDTTQLLLSTEVPPGRIPHTINYY